MARVFEGPTNVTIPATDDDQCDWGGVFHPPAEVFDVDGKWCTYTCQSLDRMSEITVWRQAAGAR